jgi:hypothetical protein
LTAAFAAVLLFSVALATPLSSRAERPEVAQSKDDGTIHFDLAPCPTLAAHGTTPVKVEAWFKPTTGSNVVAQKRFSWTSQSKKHLTFDLNVPAGFYHYAVVANFGKTACDYQRFAAVLPQKTQTIADEMDDGLANPLTAVLFAGTLPQGVSAWMVRYDGNPDCGQPVDALARHTLLDVQVQNGAFYGYDVPRGRAGLGAATAFGLELGWPDDRRRVVLLQAVFPKTPDAEAVGVRFDITPAVAQKLLTESSGVLLCADSTAP